MVDEPERRAELDAELQDVVAALFVTTNPIPLKAALEMLGLIPSGGLRLPLVEADDEGRAVVRAMLERHGLLEAVGR
jgi:4-hydroxy-tetrahydrodipicolinate synthase